MAQYMKNLDRELLGNVLDFCRRIAGSCQITAACVCGDYALGLANTGTPLEVLLVIRDFQPRLMNYVKVSEERNIIVSAVDKWVFERDVDKGFLGEAVVGGLIFPYAALTNEDYLHLQEVKLKKRLIVELMESLVLAFPEFSYEMHIKPEYFMYETILSRARLFPPMMYSLLNFMRDDVEETNVRCVLQGYLEALKELEKEELINLSNGYVRISEKFTDSVKSRKFRFTSLYKSAQKAQRALFSSLLNVIPRSMSFFSRNMEVLPRFQRFVEGNSRMFHRLEDPQNYLFVPTASGLVPLANRMDIEAFARKILAASKDIKVEVEGIGGVLNDVYLVRAYADSEEKKIVVKSFRDWSSFKWFPLTLWTVGTRTFTVSGRSRLERECAISQLLHSKGFAVPEVLYVSPSERLIFMEYVEGESLEKRVKKIFSLKNELEMKKKLRVIRRVGEKLAQIHALGIALGDTKPENFMLGKSDKLYILDFEQASRNGDKVWDVAEFLYYAGHYISPLLGTRSVELFTEAFVAGYLRVGGNIQVVKKAANPKYTKVFSIFTLPHIMLAVSSMCRKADKLNE